MDKKIKELKTIIETNMTDAQNGHIGSQQAVMNAQIELEKLEGKKAKEFFMKLLLA